MRTGTFGDDRRRCVISDGAREAGQLECSLCGERGTSRPLDTIDQVDLGLSRVSCGDLCGLGGVRRVLHLPLGESLEFVALLA